MHYFKITLQPNSVTFGRGYNVYGRVQYQGNELIHEKISIASLKLKLLIQTIYLIQASISAEY